MEFIFIVIIVILLYLIFKPRKPKVNSFDEYLIQRHKESEAKAALIPTVDTSNPIKVEVVNNGGQQILKMSTLPWTADLYFGMIKSESDRHDINALRLEACQALNITQEMLDAELETWVPNKYSKKGNI